MLERRVELVAEFVARAAVALAERIAALDHEAVDHAVEDDPVIERRGLLLPRLRIGPFLRAFGQADEIGDGIRRLGLKELYRETAFGGVELRVGCHWLILSSKGHG